MKRFGLSLLFLILSFGLSYGLSFDVTKVGGGTATEIYVNEPFTIEFYASFIQGDSIRVGWSTPFRFYGFDSVKTLVSPGVFINESAFDNYWGFRFDPNNNSGTLESWDGDLTDNAGGLTGDQFNYSAVALSPVLPNSGSMLVFSVQFEGIVGDENTVGTFCVDSGNFVNDTYDWLLDSVPNIVGFDPVCWDVIDTSYHPATTLAIPDVESQDCSEACVPVTVGNFSEVAGVQLHINYEDSCLTYDSVSLGNLTGATVDGGSGEINIVWEDLMNPLTLADGDTLAQLCFSELSAYACPIGFQGICKLLDTEGDSISLETTDGSLWCVCNPPSTPDDPHAGDTVSANLGYSVCLGNVDDATYYDLMEIIDTDTTIHTGPTSCFDLENPPGTYYYRGRACNDCGCSDWGPEISVVVCDPPPVPAGIYAPDTVFENTDFDVCWNQVEEATFYRFWESDGNTSSNMDLGPDTCITINRAVGTYMYQVYSGNACGISAEGTQIMTVVVIACDPPMITCPEIDIDTTVCAGQEICINLPITGADSVWTDANSWEAGRLCFTPYSSDAYPFTVIAVNDCGEDTCHLTINVTAVDPVEITCPGSITYDTLCGAGSICVSVPISGADDVFVLGPANWSDDSLCFMADTTGTYIFGIEASNMCGQQNCGVSVHVVVNDIPTVPDGPFGPDSVEASADYNVCWNTVEEADYYIIAQYDSTSLLSLDTLIDTCFTYNNSGGTYFYSVTACNDCGCSDWSEEIMVVVEKPIIVCATLDLPDYFYDGCDSIFLPIKVGDFCEIAGVELHIPYDTTCLTFKYVAEGQLTGATINESDGIINIVWEDFMNPLCLADSEALASLCFDGSGEDPCPVGFDDNCEVVDTNGDPICLNTYDGSLACVPVCDTVAIDCPGFPFFVDLCEPDSISVPLVINNADNIIVDGAVWMNDELTFFADRDSVYTFAVYADNECSNDSCFVVVDVNIPSAPTACFQPSAQSGTAPLEVAFSNCSVCDDSCVYYWDFGDDTYSSEFEPTHTYADTGCYAVSLIAINECGDSDTVVMEDAVCVTEIYPPEWINVYCAAPTLNDIPLSPGDVITAYDPDGVLCGSGEVEADGSYGFIPIYRDDPTTPEDEGAEPGDAISFRINDAEVTTDPIIYWTANGEYFELCEFSSERCLTYDLAEGWNWISWNVQYTDDIRQFVRDFESCIDVVLSFDQGGLTYVPELYDFSTLTDVDYYHGYLIKMSCPAEFELCGPDIDESEGIQVFTGWNLISYWPTDELLVEDALASIINSTSVVLGYENVGLTWAPDFVDFNTLTHMKPQFGYWLKSSADAILSYPGFIPPPFAAKTDYQTYKVIPSRSWMSVYGAGITLDGQPIAANATIDIRTEDGILCGSSALSGGVLRFTPVYGHDDADRITSSYPNQGATLDVYVNGVRAYPDLDWDGNAYVRLEALSSTKDGTESVRPGAYTLYQNYPNPFNPQTTIKFNLPTAGHAELSIYNMLGQKIRTLANEAFSSGEHEKIWDGRSDDGQLMASGVYFYRLKSEDFTQTKKMNLMK